MPSSELGWYEDFNPDRENSARPVSAGVFRRLVGNINQIGDQASQRRVNWWPISGVYFEPETTATLVANTWYRAWHSAPFDLHLYTPVGAGELRSYGLRTRLSGAASALAGTCEFRVVIAAENTGAIDASTPAVVSPSTNVSMFFTTSTGHAWLTPDRAITYLDASHCTRAARDISVSNIIGGASSLTSWLRCTCEVWAFTSATASVPRVSGVIVDEYWTP